MANLISKPYYRVINPDNPNGKKMIAQMIASLEDEDKFDLSQENIIYFKDNLEEAVNTFYFSMVVHAILIKYDTAGTVLQTMNLLIEPNLCPLSAVLNFTQQIWGNTDGDHIINSNGIVETNTRVLQQ